MTTPAFFIIAGEASGDLHGAHLINSLPPEIIINCYAMGSQQLANAGAKIIVDSKDLAVVGFVEVLAKLKLIRSAFKKLISAIKIHQPSLIILIDYPGFNLRLAKKIKQQSPHTKILYYISPQIWAWRYKRIYHIKKFIDFMAVIFPFEVPIYQKVDVRAKFVGHPLVDKVKCSLHPKESRLVLGLQQTSQVIGLMPGSRANELRYILPNLLRAAEILSTKIPDSEFILILAPTLTPANLKPYLAQTKLKIKLIVDKHYEAIATCNALITASGTATLEVAMLAKPMVIVYRGSFMTYAIAKCLVKVQHIGLCNIVAEKKIVKELIQNQATPKQIATEIYRIIQDQDYRNQMIEQLKQVNEKLQQQNVTEKLSNIVLEMLSSPVDRLRKVRWSYV